jgi:PPOX class probable F420-dependent enzyme
LKKIPESFLDLVNCPPVAALTTIFPNGQPHTSVVWCDFDGTHILLNTMLGFQKEKNIRGNPKVSLLCYDPKQPLRFIEIRGRVVETTEAGALEHLDLLAKLYTGNAQYFGGCVPIEFKETETTVLYKIFPNHIVTVDARPKKVEEVSPIPC